MRIRSTKPEFWRSKRVASVSWDARLVVKGLESYVDDNGVGKNDLALIVADVFPRDLSRNPPGTLQKVSEAISELSEAGLVWQYEYDGTDYLYISFWESIQRIEKPTKGRFRRPDGTLNYRDSTIGAPFREDSGNVPGGLRPGTGEQRNRGTEEQGIFTSAFADEATSPDDEPEPEERADVDTLCDHLADLIASNGSKRPTVTKGWRDAARLMLDKDGRTEQEIHGAIVWSQAHEFWRSNILSMPKLREKYDQLRLQAEREQRPAGRARNDIDWDAAFERAAAKEHHQTAIEGRR